MQNLFPGQQPNETVYLAVREHWFLLGIKLIIWLFFAACFWTINYYLSTNVPWLFTGQIGQITSLFFQLFMMFLFLSLFVIWTVYYLNIHIVTDERIVDIDQVGLFSHTVSELNIDKIEDVTSEVHGIAGHIFNYGTVFIQTAGTKERFDFRNVPNPGYISKLVLELYEKQTTKSISQ